MKAGIHPRYAAATVSCACGNSFETRSTKPQIKLEICSACHPFFTGQQRLVDSAGRVERFNKRFEATGGKMVRRKPAKFFIAKPAAAPKTGQVLSTAPKKIEKTRAARTAAKK